MADTEVRLGGTSPEEIAYRLFTHIQNVEKIAVNGSDNLQPGWKNADREWILNTFANCMITVKQPSYRL